MRTIVPGPPPDSRYAFRILAPLAVLVPAFVAGCGGGSGPEAVTPAQAHMFAHFDRAGEVHHALLQGNLNRARAAASWIANHSDPHPLPPDCAEYQDAMEGQAARVSRAHSLEEAAAGAAHMGRFCGECHRHQGVVPRFLVGTAPPAEPGTRGEMTLNLWAAERMWEGLLAGEEYAWNSGAEALRQGWLDPRYLSGDPAHHQVLRTLVQRVYRLGARAEDVEDFEARAVLYGEFLTTCMECHRQTRSLLQEPG